MSKLIISEMVLFDEPQNNKQTKAQNEILLR